MSAPGKYLSTAELIDYIKVHKRGTIDDEIIEKLERYIKYVKFLELHVKTLDDMIERREQTIRSLEKK